jgi:hypothetical protein
MRLRELTSIPTPEIVWGVAGVGENVKICWHITPHHIITRKMSRQTLVGRQMNKQKGGILVEPKTSENLMY